MVWKVVALVCSAFHVDDRFDYSLAELIFVAGVILTKNVWRLSQVLLQASQPVVAQQKIVRQ